MAEQSAGGDDGGKGGAGGGEGGGGEGGGGEGEQPETELEGLQAVPDVGCVQWQMRTSEPCVAG